MSPTGSNASLAGRFDRLSVGFALGGVLLLYYLAPLASLLVAQPPGVVLDRLRDPEIVSAAATSLATAAASTAVAVAFGLPLSYWLARAEGRFAELVTAAVVLPLVLPPIVGGMVLLTVVGRDALLGGFAAAHGFPLTRSLAGIVLAQTFVSSPFFVVAAKASFEGVDRSLEDAARTLGRGRFETVRRVTLPLAWPGVLAGATLAFARSMGEFGATLMLAYYPRTMPVQIWVSFTTRGVENAFPAAVVLVGVSVATLVAVNALGSNPLE